MKRFLGLLIIAAGTLWLLQSMNILDLSFLNTGYYRALIFPACVILFGLIILFGKNKNVGQQCCSGVSNQTIPELPEGEIPKMSVSFSGSNYNFSDREFHGAKLEAFMGGISIDLRNAVINSDVVLDVHTFMGGVEVKVPSNLRISIQSQCFMGGVGNHSFQQTSPDAHTLTLRANCMLGGVDLKN